MLRSFSGDSPYLTRCPSNEHRGSSGEAAAEVESNPVKSGRRICDLNSMLMDLFEITKINVSGK